MAKTKISQYDATAANNTDIDSINIAEGMAPSNVNNAIRELMAHLKDMDAGTQALTSPQLTSADINGGTIDGVTIGGASAGAITGTTITANTSLNIAGDGATVTGIKDEDDMASNSATKLATQQSIKAYVDAQVGTVDTLAEVLGNGNTTGGTDIAVSTGDDITFADSSKAIFGAGSDLQIYHDGSRSIIQDNGTGNLRIQANNLELNNADNSENYLFAANNGAVTLYYDNAEKLATTSTGIDVTGTVTADALNVSAASPNIDVTDTGTSHASQDFLTNSNAVRATIGVERSAGGGLFVGSSPYAAVFGTASAGNTEFATNNNVRMTISSAGNVGIGTSSPQGVLDLGGASSGRSLTFAKYNNIFGSYSEGSLNLTSNYYGDTTANAYKTSSTATFGAAGIEISGTGGTSTSGLIQFFVDAAASKTAGDAFVPTERMRIDSSGNLLVGHTAEGTWDANNSAILRASGVATFTSTSTPPLYANLLTSDGDIVSFRKDGAPVGIIGTIGGDTITIGSGDTGLLMNQTNDEIIPWNTSTNAARDGFIDLGDASHRFKDLHLSGTAYVGLSSVISAGDQGIQVDGGNGIIYIGRGSTSVSTHISFLNPNGEVGKITTTGSSTSYVTSSDYRLKENVVNLTSATTRLKQLEPKRFNFIADADTTVDGFFAHEVQSVVPEAVTGAKDAMRDEEYEVTPAVLDDDGNVVTEAVMGTRSVPDYQGIDQSKLVPLLVATIKELEARITALENA